MRQYLALIALAFAGSAWSAETRSDAVFAALDTNHDSSVSREEFAAGYARVQQAIAVEARLRNQFAIVDANHDNGLDAGEYAKLALVVRAGKAAPAITTFDGNRDGTLDFDEYRGLVQRLGAAPAAAKE